MGYTHYWTPKNANKETWMKFLKVARELKKNLPKTSETAGGYHSDNPIVIRGGMGTGPAEFKGDGIWFNGNEAKGLDHETFMISPTKSDWNFCKTARKPYDLLVCAVLIAAHEYLGYEVSSDGDLEDWLPAIEYYSTVEYGRPKALMNMGKDLRQYILPEFLYKETVDYKRKKLKV